MKEIVRTFLPLLTWHFQKIFGSVISADEWRAWALALVPPPDNLANTVEKECAEYDSPALLSSSARRRLRRWAQGRLRRQLRNDPFVLPVREYLRMRRAATEVKDFKTDVSRLDKWKWRDAEIDLANRWLSLFSGEEPPDELQAVINSHPDALNLLWELATHGCTGQKPRLRRNTALYGIMGIDPSQLENARPEDAPIIFSLLFDRVGLGDSPPEQATVLKLIWWFVTQLLPPESEPSKEPNVINKATEAGIIHKGVVTRKDEETGEVKEIDVVDPTTMQPDFLDLEGDEAIIAHFASKGINYDDLTPKEWAEIFERRDLMRMGYEFSSKKGVSISSFYGETAKAKEKRWSRLMRNIEDLLIKRQ